MKSCSFQKVFSAFFILSCCCYFLNPPFSLNYYLCVCQLDGSGCFASRYSYNNPFSVDNPDAENKRLDDWKEYFEEFGSGMSMYRNERLKHLVLNGLPEGKRGILWMILSGAENEVTKFTNFSKLLPSYLMNVI